MKKILHKSVADNKVDIPYITPIGKNTVLKGCPITLDIIEPAYLHKVDNADHTIIYDEFNKHYDVL